MPTGTLFEFIIYLIPGFLATQVYRSFYPVKQRSDFIEITWSVIYSLAVFASVKIIDVYLLNFQLKSNVTGFPSLRFITALLITGLLFGFLLYLVHAIRINISDWHQNLSFLTPDPQSIWAKVAPNGQWAVVYLDDDTIYIGWIAHYSFIPDHPDQDFLLADAKRVNDDLEEKYVIDGIGVYLNTRNVKRIEFLKPKVKLS